MKIRQQYLLLILLLVSCAAITPQKQEEAEYWRSGMWNGEVDIGEETNSGYVPEERMGLTIKKVIHKERPKPKVEHECNVNTQEFKEEYLGKIDCLLENEK